MRRKLITGLLYIGLVLTPVFGVQDLLSNIRIFSGLMNNETVIFIKATKDLLLIAIFLLFLIDVLIGGKFVSSLFVWSMLTIILISFFITFLEVSPFLSLVGLRVFSPFLFIFIAYKYFDMRTIKTVVRILSFLLVFEFCMALVQAFYGLPLEGLTYFGLAARPFGTFVHPWSFAVFVCFVLCFRMGYDAFSHEVLSKTTCVFIMVSIFFIFLAGSGTGVIALSVILISYFLLFWKAHPYVKAAVFPVALLIPILVFANMVLLTGRHDIFKSVQGRINVFTNLMSTSSVKDVLIGKGLGIGSNAALSFLKLDPIAVQGAKMLFVADTLLTSVISQTGVLFLLLFVAFNAYLLMRVINGKYQGANPIALLAIPCAAVASLGSNVIELYPVNWLLFIVYGLAMKRSGKILR